MSTAAGGEVRPTRLDPSAPRGYITPDDMAEGAGFAAPRVDTAAVVGLLHELRTALVRCPACRTSSTTAHEPDGPACQEWRHEREWTMRDE